MAADFKPCSIAGCKGNAQGGKGGAFGYCVKHYKRLKRHGDPLVKGLPRGEAAPFYRDVVVPYDGDECLIWPYARTPAGYGVLDGHKIKVVSRRLCEEAYGPPPTPKHHAAHSCGNGHLGCVTRRHLSWKTPKENGADRIAHTLLRKQKH